MEKHLINVTIPVYNEAHVLAHSIEAVDTFLKANSPCPYEVVIADNASQDSTLKVARDLAKVYKDIRVLHLDEKGRGRALKRAWLESSATVLSYMDVDLSTDLAFYLPLLEPLLSGGADIAIGSRLLSGSVTRRGCKREFISRCYNLLVRLFFQTHFSDAQCGFKAITREAAGELLPFVEDTGWFFDTELLVLAQKRDYRIYDLAVRWTDDPDSRVKIFKTALDDMKGLIRVKRNFAKGYYSSARPTSVCKERKNKSITIH
jgi:glycosyltransferase involved in cell wall biosynthesis